MRSPADFLRRNKLFCKDSDVALALFAAFSTIAASNALSRSYFNADCQVDVLRARAYLQRPLGDFRIYDHFTKGFINSVVYTPFLWILDRLGVPWGPQDLIAISTVYAILIGMIAVLAYYCSRSFISKQASVVVTVLTLSSVCLIQNYETWSPNGELMGCPVLLGIWYTLIHKRPGYWVATCILLGSLAFHIKYQLMPQATAFVILSEGSKVNKWKILAGIALVSLALDLIVYRLAGEGFLSTASSLVFEYSSRTSTPNALHSGGIPQRLADILRTTPQFFAAWALWLPALLRQARFKPFKSEEQDSRFSLHSDLIASLLMSIVTGSSIIFSGKEFLHYYLLLIPTTTFVAVMALRHLVFAKQSIPS